MVGNPLTAISPSDNTSDLTLRSWKEIAAYLDCSVSTAQRWEKREGLPVRRHIHEKLGSANASASEIERWKRERTWQRPSVSDPSRVL